MYRGEVEASVMMLIGPPAERAAVRGSMWKVPRGTGYGKVSDCAESMWVMP